MTLTICCSTSYHRYILRVCRDDFERIPVEVVQVARQMYVPDRRPGCEIISQGQVKLIRSTPPAPDCAAQLARRLRAMGYDCYR